MSRMDAMVRANWCALRSMASTDDELMTPNLRGQSWLRP